MTNRNFFDFVLIKLAEYLRQQNGYVAVQRNYERLISARIKIALCKRREDAGSLTNLRLVFHPSSPRKTIEAYSGPSVFLNKVTILRESYNDGFVSFHLGNLFYELHERCGNA